MIDTFNLFSEGKFKRGILLLFENHKWDIKTDSKKLDFNKDWLKIAKNENIIAHKLGNYKIPNSLESVNQSLANGIKFMEIDIGIINNKLCNLEINRNEDCDLLMILELAVIKNFFLVIDFKDISFKEGITKLLFLLEQNPNGEEINKKIIFQLYKPNHIKEIIRINQNKKFRLNLPIITLYRSQTPLYSFIRQKPIIFKAITIPFSRKYELEKIENINEFLFMTHPIKNCGEYRNAKLNKFNIVYAPTEVVKCF